jgi:hypothetical protein
MIEARGSKSFADAASKAATPKRRAQVSPLTWLNLVCLDAPLVAMGWQMLFARSFRVWPTVGATTALFLTAWLIYLGDRFGDSLSTDLTRATALRQRFCIRHRTAWLVTIALVAVADVVAIGVSIRGAELLFGGAIGLCAIIYLAINRLRPDLWRIIPLKEVSIGFLFAAGTIVPLAHGGTSAMLPGWLLFGCLCSLNCICIAVWERFLDTAQERISIATEFPVLGQVIVVAAGAELLVGALVARWAWPTPAIYGSVAASAALLIFLHIFRTRISQDVRTALADIALLTPFVALIIQLIR